MGLDQHVTVPKTNDPHFRPLLDNDLIQHESRSVWVCAAHFSSVDFFFSKCPPQLMRKIIKPLGGVSAVSLWEVVSLSAWAGVPRTHRIVTFGDLTFECSANSRTTLRKFPSPVRGLPTKPEIFSWTTGCSRRQFLNCISMAELSQQHSRTDSSWNAAQESYFLHVNPTPTPVNWDEHLTPRASKYFPKFVSFALQISGQETVSNARGRKLKMKLRILPRSYNNRTHTLEVLPFVSVYRTRPGCPVKSDWRTTRKTILSVGTEMASPAAFKSQISRFMPQTLKFSREEITDLQSDANLHRFRSGFAQLDVTSH